MGSVNIDTLPLLTARKSSPILLFLVAGIARVEGFEHELLWKVGCKYLSDKKPVAKVAFGIVNWFGEREGVEP